MSYVSVITKYGWFRHLISPQIHLLGITLTHDYTVAAAVAAFDRPEHQTFYGSLKERLEAEKESVVPPVVQLEYSYIF